MGKKSRQKRTCRTGTGSIPLNAEAVDALKEQLARFREKFGRDPGADGPVFFNPDSSLKTLRLKSPLLGIPLTHQTPTCRFGRWRITDRKSTRLNSSLA